MRCCWFRPPLGWDTYPNAAPTGPAPSGSVPAGVLRQEGEKDTGTFFLIPCDPRMPRMIVRSALMPPQIKQARRVGRREVAP